ncbi:MAG: DUF433 domain-containing protein [Spirosomaceae bacterium]|jgi:uncharacterized protein (DUF433 family)|nr:DUF433 domain-containing protein [Spirosomataceae bacterium]
MTLSFNQFESLLAQLSATKKAQLLYLISQQLGETFPGIEKTPHVCGGSACIIRTRIPVWTLVSFKKTGMNDPALLEAYPTLRKQDLNNAWAYYKANKKEIDQDIQENAA